MNLVRIVPPPELPLTLAELKAQVRMGDLDDPAEDALMMGYLRAAIAEIENPIGHYAHALITQEWELRLDGFPSNGDAIQIPLAPVQSIVSVGDLTSHQVAGIGGRARIFPAFGGSWPSNGGAVESVIVRFVAGYGDDANDVPENIRYALMLMVAEAVCDREGEMGMPEGAKALLSPYKRPSLA